MKDALQVLSILGVAGAIALFIHTRYTITPCASEYAPGVYRLDRWTGNVRAYVWDADARLYRSFDALSSDGGNIIDWRPHTR